MFKYQLEDFQRWLDQHNALIVNLIENKLKPLQEEIEKIKEEMRMQSLYKRYIPSIHELIEMGFSQRPGSRYSYFLTITKGSGTIRYNTNSEEFSFDHKKFYPQSRSELENIIFIFTRK